MASNYFGQIFRITTFGESHGACIGVVIDGCPANLPITEEDIAQELFFRKPGKTLWTSPRQELDTPKIVSGVLEGKTTGAPLTILIENKGHDSTPYQEIQNLYRPGHANFTYLQKYGIFDPKGGGRSSARETAARVAAGAVAKKILSFFEMECIAFIQEIGGIAIDMVQVSHFETLREQVKSDPIFCPDTKTSLQMQQSILEAKNRQDSLGGIVGCIAKIMPGLGDPIYGKLEARLASAMLSIPASKGFEIGDGFASARMRGSEHNDPFDLDREGMAVCATNHAGGVLGGISTGSPLFFKVAFKPTSSILKPQQTVNLQGEKTIFQLPKNGKHDPCVAIRAVPVVEAMTAICLADALLCNESAQMKNLSPLKL
jgi:chorismate synthase